MPAASRCLRPARRLAAAGAAAACAAGIAGCASAAAPGGAAASTNTAQSPAAHATRPRPAPRAVSAKGLHVDGNRLLDARGHVIVFHGVNRSGTEYACVQGQGIFDGPATAASVRAIARWHANAVRIPLNESCWLGLHGVPPRFAGARYRRAVVAYVRLLERHGLYPMLSLMWGAPGRHPATYQSGAPDRDHSPSAWRSLARTFRHDHDVVLAPWGETVVDADCFLQGGVCEATYGPRNRPYATAGMQQAVDVMRGAGYTGVIAIPGVDRANDLSGWLAHEPRDPLRQLVAEAHVYGDNVCAATACLDRTLAPVAARVPLVLGEVGESVEDAGASACGARRVAAIVKWADAHGAGYDAWAWDAWGTCGALVGDYTGTPHAAYGRWVEAHYSRNRVTPLRVRR